MHKIMEEISAFIESPVGILKLVEVNSVITAILFGDDGNIGLGKRLPTPLLSQCDEQLNEYFEGRRKVFNFEMTQYGTNFQQRVWSQLKTIDFGKTISYNQLAIQLGDAKCIRAAGTANGKNNLSIVVPCHRVIGSNGSLTGYAGGLWRKQ